MSRWSRSLRAGLALTLPVVATAVISWGASPPELEPRDAEFPKAWIGHWKGMGRVRSMRRRDAGAREFPMELRIQPLEVGASEKPRWTWEIVYGEGEQRQVRRYELVVVDAVAGHYLIDEKNSILIDAWRVDDAKGTGLRSRFRVGDSEIDSVYRLVDGRLEVELVTYGTKVERSSGGEDKVPAVASHRLRAVQTATLRRD